MVKTSRHLSVTNYKTLTLDCLNNMNMTGSRINEMNLRIQSYRSIHQPCKPNLVRTCCFLDMLPLPKVLTCFKNIHAPSLSSEINYLDFLTSLINLKLFIINNIRLDDVITNNFWLLQDCECLCSFYYHIFQTIFVDGMYCRFYLCHVCVFVDVLECYCTW